MGLVNEFLAFVKYRKKYWLVPLLIILGLLALLAVIVESSAIMPFIYTIF